MQKIVTLQNEISGLGQEIDIHEKRGRIEEVYAEIIGGINASILHATESGNYRDRIRLNIKLKVAEGEKRKHIYNLHVVKNQYQLEWNRKGYHPKTDLDNLFK
jgi:hypothetical protein